MQALRQFSIPIKGLKYGNHEYEFEIGNLLFEDFPESPIKNSSLNSNLNLEKKDDHFILSFKTSGTVETECDRCTAKIDLPIDFDFSYIIKFDEDEREEEEIIYINPENHHLHVASMLYEQILMAIPLIKVYDCQEKEPRPCNDKVLDILNSNNGITESNSLFGEVLKDLKITKTK